MTIVVRYTDGDTELFSTSLYDSMYAAAWTSMDFNPSGNELIAAEKMLATTLMQFILDQLRRAESAAKRAAEITQHPNGHPRLTVARAAFEDARSHLQIASMLAVKGIVEFEKGVDAVNERRRHLAGYTTRIAQRPDTSFLDDISPSKPPLEEKPDGSGLDASPPDC